MSGTIVQHVGAPLSDSGKARSLPYVDIRIDTAPRSR